MAWIRIEQSLVQNRKLYSLKSALRIDTAKAVGTLALLWLWAIDNARGGSLGRISDRQLAEICQFSPRRAAELREALVSSASSTPPTATSSSTTGTISAAASKNAANATAPTSAAGVVPTSARTRLPVVT